MRRNAIAAIAAVALAAAIPAAQAGGWSKDLFEAKTVEEAFKAAGISGTEQSADLTLKAPEIAENGAVVPVDVSTRIPGATAIILIADKNPLPVLARFDLAPGAPADVSARVKLGQTSKVRAIVLAGGKAFSVEKEVKVTVGGCGG